LDAQICSNAASASKTGTQIRLFTAHEHAQKQIGKMATKGSARKSHPRWWPLERDLRTVTTGAKIGASVKTVACTMATWKSLLDGEDSDGEIELGFGGYVREESDDARREFEVEMGGDKLKFLEDNDNSFRWTCCGLTASQGTRRVELS
jgi:hypothetical protein